MAHALEEGLSVIACIGETLDERDGNKTTASVWTCLTSVLKPDTSRLVFESKICRHQSRLISGIESVLEAECDRETYGDEIEKWNAEKEFGDENCQNFFSSERRLFELERLDLGKNF